MVSSFISGIDNALGNNYILEMCLGVVGFWLLSLLGMRSCCLFGLAPSSLVVDYRIVYDPWTVLVLGFKETIDHYNYVMLVNIVQLVITIASSIV